jgi:cysteine desulfurase
VQRYYFDHNATTPVSGEVLEAMLPLLTEVYGNASSVHHFGQAARKKLDDSHRHVAAMLGAAPEEIVFTSGGTEADNLAIFGTGGHVITTTVEHPAVLAACAKTNSYTAVPVDSSGVIDPDAIRSAIQSDTRLISVMHANNELGTIQPILEIARIAHAAGITFHSDGVQAAGKVPVDVKALGVDLYSISGHKLYAPKGVGALYVRKGTKLQPMMFGGRHERGLRAGTENVPGAVGLARSAQWMMENSVRESQREADLRDMLERAVLDRIADTHVNGAGAPRTPNTTNIRFDGIDSDALLIALDLRGFAVSSGAACSSGSTEPSHVLLAIGLTKLEARSSIRFSLGRANDAQQVEALIGALEESVAHLRKLAPAYA